MLNSNKASRVDKTDYNKAAVISRSAILDVLFDGLRRPRAEIMSLV